VKISPYLAKSAGVAIRREPGGSPSASAHGHDIQVRQSHLPSEEWAIQ
jgi:hypothetical protein